MSIFGVYVVDTHNIATQYMEYEDTSNVLFCDLAEDMNDKGLYSRPNTPH